MSSNNTKPGSLPAWLCHPLTWALVCLIGTVLWIYCVSFLDAPRAWRSLLINFIYFTPIAAGLVAWPAVVLLSRGTWLKPVQYSALTGLSFAPASLIVFAALYFGRSYWASWIHEPNLHNAAWINVPFLFSRDAFALVLQWILSLALVLQSRKTISKVLAAWLVLAYCLTFSLIAFDLVMALDPHWYSALFGGYFFISALYGAIVAWTIGALVRHPDLDNAHKRDFGSLIVAFSILTTYLLYSQLIVIWYENLPHEVRQVLPRLMEKPWQTVSATLLIIVYLGPLVFLLTRWSKRNRYYLGTFSVIVLICLWVERWWEVTPTLKAPLTIGLPEIASIFALLGAFLFGVSLLSRYLPDPGIEESLQT